MFAADRPVLFLKATVLQTITVPGYHRHDGTYVPPHQKKVHIDPDKSKADVLAGKGSHSQKVALKKLAKLPHWSGLSEDDQHAHVLSSATNYQQKQSAAAAVSGWKAAMLAGKKPSASQQAAFDALPEAKKAELLAAVGKAPDGGGSVAKKIKIASVGPELDLDAAAAASKDDIASGKIKNLKFDPSLKNEAEAGFASGVIRVGEKFFALSPEARKHVLAHEQAHYDAEKIGLSVSIDLADAGVFGKQSPDGTLMDGPGGQWKPDEALTESLALYQTDPDHLKQKYPDAYAVAEAYYTDGSLPKSVADKVEKVKAAKQAEASASASKFDQAEAAIKAKIAAAASEEEKAKYKQDWKNLLLNDVYPDWLSAAPKDAALQAAIDHLKEDAQQGNLPAEEKAEDAALVAKLEGAKGGAPAAVGDVFTLDSQYEKMNAGKWTVYNVSPDGALVYMHKVGAKVPNQKNSATIPVETLQAAIAAGTAKKDAPAPAPDPFPTFADHDKADEAAAQAEAGPKEGDTKQKDGKTYVLKNGRWRLQVTEQEAAEDKADLADALLSGDHSKASELVAKIHEAEFGHEADSGETKVSFPLADPHLYSAALDASNKALAAYGKTNPKDHPVESVPADKLRAIQGTVTEAQVKKYAAEGFADKGYPVAIEKDGLYYVVDGTHRVEAQLRAGKVPQMHVVHVAQDTQSPAPAPAAVVTPAESAPAAGAGHQPGTLDEASAKHAEAQQYLTDALEGKLGHYPGKAAMKVSADLPLLEKVEAIKKLASEMQAAATISAAFSGWKKSAVSGKNPTPAQWKAFYAQSNAKQAAALADVEKVAGSLGHLSAPAVDVPAGSPKAEAAEQADALDPKVQEVIDTLADAYAKGDAEALNLVIDANKPGTPVHDYAAKKKAEADAAKPAAPAAGWKYDPSDNLFAGDPSLTINTPDGGLIYIGWSGDVSEYLIGKMDADGQPVAFENYFPGLAGMGEYLEKLGVPPEQHPSPSDIEKLSGGAAPPADGPQDGDTKPAADGGTLVFKDGHWHKVQEPEAEPAGGSSSATTTTLHHTTDGHNKFWSVTVDGAKVTTHYGKIGTKGSVSTKEFPSEAAAATHAAKLVQQKTGKGYYPVSSTAPAAAPAAPKVKAAAVESTTGWVQTGPQEGSNPGGKFKDASGQEWYVKTPATEDHVKNEILAAKLYQAAGIAVPDLKVVSHNGKPSVASKWVDGLSKGSAVDLANTAAATSGFGADAWLANWDAVGLGFDNLLLAGSMAVRVDVGGSLLFRAQGEAKGADFGDKVTETKTLLDAKKNPNTAAVFGAMSKEDMEASVAKVLAVSDEKIKELAQKFGPGSAADRAALAAKLIARKADLAKQYPGAAKASKLANFKPEQLSAPPDFMNWGGSGKAGPSSKAFINEANHAASQAIWAAAKTGDPEAVKALTAPVFDKDTGKETGRVPVLQHPSQWVRGFAQQMLNELDFQLNPPKKFRFDGGHPLAALDDAYPVAKVGAGGAAKKLGEFLVLGAPGTVDLAPEFKPEPITYKSGKLTRMTYSKVAQAAIAKLPNTQKQAIKAYTGSSYSSMNKSLWSGNPAGEAMAAAEGLHTVGHEITPGTVLSRKLYLSSVDIAQLQKAAGMILQEPAIMSTSIRPSCWSGNVHFKLNVGPGVKGLYVGPYSLPGGKALSKNSGEDEVILPPNTRLLVQSVKASPSGGDEDGFGDGPKYIVEVLVLPTKE